MPKASLGRSPGDDMARLEPTSAQLLNHEVRGSGQLMVNVRTADCLEVGTVIVLPPNTAVVVGPSTVVAARAAPDRLLPAGPPDTGAPC